MLAARRETLSIYNELRVLAWSGAMLIATGAGIIIRKHFDDIGPLTIAIILGLTAIACYAWVAVKRHAPLDEYIVLLGALLISANVAFIEQQWHLLGAHWQRHFLLLAVLHAVAAYFFDSKAVLSLAVAALAAWFGLQGGPDPTDDFAIHAFAAAGLIGLCRVANRRAHFNPVFEHAAGTLMFWGAVALSFQRGTHLLGVGLALVMSAAAIVYGVRREREAFVIYGYVYALLSLYSFIPSLWGSELRLVFFLLVSTIGVIFAMMVTLRRMKR